MRFRDFEMCCVIPRETQNHPGLKVKICRGLLRPNGRINVAYSDFKADVPLALVTMMMFTLDNGPPPPSVGQFSVTCCDNTNVASQNRASTLANINHYSIDQTK